MPPDALQENFWANCPEAPLAHWDAHSRQSLDLMLQGERTKDIAEKVGKLQGRISQMRDEFSFSWFAFIEERG